MPRGIKVNGGCKGWGGGGGGGVVVPSNEFKVRFSESKIHWFIPWFRAWYSGDSR